MVDPTSLVADAVPAQPYGCTSRAIPSTNTTPLRVSPTQVAAAGLMVHPTTALPSPETPVAKLPSLGTMVPRSDMPFRASHRKAWTWVGVTFAEPTITEPSADTALPWLRLGFP